MKKTFNSIPELYFMGMGLFWAAENYFTSGTVNYFALLVTWLLFLQIIYKNRFIGLVYGVILTLFSAYMVLAVVSEFSEAKAFELIVVGGTLFATGVYMGALMVYKFAKAEAAYDESVLTVTY
jgi:hypothetical protein